MHIVFFWQNTSCIRKPPGHLMGGDGGGGGGGGGGGRVRSRCTLPLDPPAPGIVCVKSSVLSGEKYIFCCNLKME